MLGVDRRSVQNFDWVLCGLVALLVAVGLVNLFSSTHTDAGLSGEMRRQFVSLGIGLVALLVTVVIALPGLLLLYLLRGRIEAMMQDGDA